MLPFSSFEFFIVMAIFIVVAALCTFFIDDKNYKYLLASFNFLFLAIIYPKPYHFFLLIFYSYAATYLLSEKIHFSKKRVSYVW